MTIAVFPGSFDPITHGHLDVIRKASVAFDSVVVAVLHNSNKTPLFSTEERVALIASCVKPFANVTVDHFSGLTVDFLARAGASVLVRGLRDASDFASESRMAHLNRQLSPNATTWFVLTELDHAAISSTMVKEIARHGGDVSHMVPHDVAQALRRKLPS